jgi:hypothetical protein
MILELLASVIQQLAKGTPVWKISMPSAIHTDMSGLHGVQLLTFRNYECLSRFEQLDTCEDPVIRLGLVISGLIDPHTEFFLEKPFNPVLGEFIECKTENGQYCFRCEQVSHHPPIAAVQIDGPSFKLFAPNGVTIDAFRTISPGFNKLDLQFPECYLRVETKSGKTLYWQNFGYRVDGLIGKRACYHFGPIEITDLSGYKFVGHVDQSKLKGKVIGPEGALIGNVQGTMEQGVYFGDGRVWITPVADHPIKCIYTPEVLKDPMFSDNVWKNVLYYMRQIPRDFKMADVEKGKVEHSQRERAKVGGYSPRFPLIHKKEE